MSPVTIVNIVHPPTSGSKECFYFSKHLAVHLYHYEAKQESGALLSEALKKYGGASVWWAEQRYWGGADKKWGGGEWGYATLLVQG